MSDVTERQVSPPSDILQMIVKWKEQYGFADEQSALWLEQVQDTEMDTLHTRRNAMKDEMYLPVCDECEKVFSMAEWDNRHTGHESNCPNCNRSGRT